MNRIVRYQGAIVQEHKLLLIKHQEHAGGRTYWLIPGGGIEEGETEEACVQREMREETCLEVDVVRLLLEEPGRSGEMYPRYKTYLCEVRSGEARPGYEPEEEGSDNYAILEVGWFDLRDPASWDALAVNDPFTGPRLRKIREVLGY